MPGKSMVWRIELAKYFCLADLYVPQYKGKFAVKLKAIWWKKQTDRRDPVTNIFRDNELYHGNDENQKHLFDAYRFSALEKFINFTK